MASHTDSTPWTVIHSNDKKKARINCIKHILNQVDYPEKVKQKHLKVDKKIVCTADDKIAKFDKYVSLSISDDKSKE
jgi:hypothetical protein